MLVQPCKRVIEFQFIRDRYELKSIYKASVTEQLPRSVVGASSLLGFPGKLAERLAKIVAKYLSNINRKLAK